MKVKCRLQIGGLHVMASVRQTNAGWSWIVLHCMVKCRNSVFKIFLAVYQINKSARVFQDDINPVLPEASLEMPWFVLCQWLIVDLTYNTQCVRTKSNHFYQVYLSNHLLYVCQKNAYFPKHHCLIHYSVHSPGRHGVSNHLQLYSSFNRLSHY